ncbi:FAD-dependent oxidoreductase [Roseovarius aestuarii]|nr:FAD-dependent oxidoreductase [Roseovarius aestuarii]
MPAKTIIVIGAGICGLSSAIWLRRAGHEVTLIDREGPGAGASFGNAGLLAEWAVVPTSTPGVALQGTKYVASGKGPVFLQWDHLPRLIPWVMQFLRNSTDAHTRRISGHLAHLLHDSVDQHRALTKGTLAEKWIASSDFTYVYTNRAAFDGDAYGWELKREAGYIPELIEGAAAHEAEPMLAPNLSCLARLKGHGHILNPGAYMSDLARVLEDEGGTVMQAEMRDVTLENGRITAVLTDRGTLPCDEAVLAAGIWSKPLLQKLGVRVPLQAERGYHLQFDGASQMPSTPMMMMNCKFAVNPMQQGLRCAGFVELGGIKRGASRSVLDALHQGVSTSFPNLRYDAVEEWMGFRPSTPDSLPLVGEIAGTGVHAAFGHQHVGLTGGPKTGRWVADMISGRAPNSDLAAFDANRFS